MSGGSEVRSAARALRAAREKALRRSGNSGKKLLLSAAGPPTGGNLTYSGAGGKPLGVSVRVTSGTITSSLVIKPTGKTAGRWVWANTGTKAGRRVYRRGPRRGTVMNHPGTRGYGAWDKTAEQVKDQVLKDMEKSITESLR